MEGFILAAGLGTRLRPLTDDRPKALVEINGVTLLERAIHRLEDADIRHIVVNVHHYADMVADYVSSHRWKARIDISDERAMLLDTGGGLRHAVTLFDGLQNVLVHNVDILSDIDFHSLELHHQTQGNLVTLCVSLRQTQRLLEFDGDGRLVGRADTSHLPPSFSHLAFSGISVVSPDLFPLLPADERPYPIVDEYVRLSTAG